MDNVLPVPLVETMKHTSVFLMWLLGCFSYTASAHQPMQNDCIPPTRPADEQNDVLWQEFLADIDTFQACINANVERHQSATSEHQEAARLTVERWNQFVQQSLNAPEDFPWPPDPD